MICQHCGRETDGREHWPQGGYCVLAPTDAPQPSADEHAGMEWWNGMVEQERAVWLKRANTASAGEAWAFYKSWRAERSCVICGKPMADGHDCQRVYADPKNKQQVIDAKKEKGYDLVHWISGGYSGGDVAYFHRAGPPLAMRRDANGGET